MAVVQYGAAAASGAGKPERAAAVPIAAERIDPQWMTCAVLAGVGKSLVGPARRSQAKASSSGRSRRRRRPGGSAAVAGVNAPPLVNSRC
jgi:hypothetical protein